MVRMPSMAIARGEVNSAPGTCPRGQALDRQNIYLKEKLR